jgi:uncharacterized protein
MDRKRHIAHKVRLSDLTEGTYVRTEGEWEPNYIQAKDGRALSRINVIAVVASEPSTDQSFHSFIVDDGSGQVAVRAFGETRFTVTLGDVVLLVGRPREFSNQIYIVPEIVKRIEDPKWIEFRKRELGMPLPKIEPIQETASSAAPVDQLIAAIKTLDKGDGADTEDVIAKVKIENADHMIDTLLKEGEIFELTPGKIKVLE